MSEERVGERSKFEKVFLTAIGLVAAPILGAMASTTLLIAFTVVTTWSAPIGNVPSIIAAGGLFGGYLGLLPSLAFGWPIHLVMQHFKLDRVPHYIIGGSLIGLLTMFVTWSISSGYGSFNAPVTLLFVAAGAVGALAFWLIRRPDRDTQSALPAEDSKP